MIVYFTGTGNSRWCARQLAEHLKDRLTDAAPYLRGGIAAELCSERPWVFVCPTYAWQPPREFVAFLDAAYLSGSRDAYFVMTCGGELGVVEKTLEALCSRKGLRFRGVLEVIMPDNYLVMFRAPEPEKARQIIRAARPVLEQGAAAVAAGKDFPPRKTGVLDRIKSGPVNRGFYRFFIKSRGFRTTDACVGCGKCTELCPLQNITLNNGRPVWGERCTQCMACLNGCPKEAVEYGKATVGKRRYWCPGDTEDGAV